MQALHDASDHPSETQLRLYQLPVTQLRLSQLLATQLRLTQLRLDQVPPVQSVALHFDDAQLPPVASQPVPVHAVPLKVPPDQAGALHVRPKMSCSPVSDVPAIDTCPLPRAPSSVPVPDAAVNCCTGASVALRPSD